MNTLLTTDSIDIPQVIKSLKGAFVRQFFDGGLPDLRSMFLIGSCAGEENESSSWYQDFDIHFYFDKLVLSASNLDELKLRLDCIREEYSAPNSTIDWNLRDRHWKLIPNPSTKVNLSIHATLANRLDFQRRAQFNPILGWNMYQLCEVLHGDAAATIVPLMKPRPFDHFHSVGGTGWMIENFHRALWLFFTNPIEQRFYPYISGYCWNVASSIMLQYYTLMTSKVTTRNHALEFFLQETKIHPSLHQDVEKLLHFKYTPIVDDATAHELINATASTSRWMISALMTRLGIHSNKYSNRGLMFERDLYSDILRKSLGRLVKAREVHYWLNDKEADFYSSFKTCVDEVRTKFPNTTSLEFPETLEWLIQQEHDEVTKVYVWSEINIIRFLLSTDFDFAKSHPTFHSAMWGWESGCQATLQRLHEFYIAKGVTAVTECLARSLTSVVDHHFTNIGLALPPVREDTYFDYAHHLAAIAKPSNLV